MTKKKEQSYNVRIVSDGKSYRVEWAHRCAQRRWTNPVTKVSVPCGEWVEASPTFINKLRERLVLGGHYNARVSILKSKGKPRTVRIETTAKIPANLDQCNVMFYDE
jgi:hypothetical protein